MEWSVEDLEALRSLRSDGLSYVAIARLLRKPRHACAYRGRLLKLPDVERRHGMRKSESRSRDEARALAGAVATLEPGQCRWPVGGRFCGCRMPVGAARWYCPTHLRLSMPPDSP